MSRLSSLILNRLFPQVESLAHTRIRDCYQCGKCTAGCPMARRNGCRAHPADSPAATWPNGKALRAQGMWQCVSCQTCSTRCPKSVDCAGIMDALRQLSFERGVTTPEQQRTVLFQKAFLGNIRRNGRLNELELIGEFKLPLSSAGGASRFCLKMRPWPRN